MMKNRNILADLFVVALALITGAGMAIIRRYNVPAELMGCDVAQSFYSTGRIIVVVVFVLFVGVPVGLTAKRKYSAAAALAIVGNLAVFFWIGWAQDGKYYQIGEPLEKVCANQVAETKK